MNSIGAWLYRYCGDTVAGVMATAWLVSSSTRLCCCSVCSFISPRGSRTEQPVLGQSTSWWLHSLRCCSSWCHKPSTGQCWLGQSIGDRAVTVLHESVACGSDDSEFYVVVTAVQSHKQCWTGRQPGAGGSITPATVSPQYLYNQAPMFIISFQWEERS